jgi:hypothetical protein
VQQEATPASSTREFFGERVRGRPISQQTSVRSQHVPARIRRHQRVRRWIRAGTCWRYGVQVVAKEIILRRAGD